MTKRGAQLERVAQFLGRLSALADKYYKNFTRWQANNIDPLESERRAKRLDRLADYYKAKYGLDQG